jgi:hypothetical protein
MWGRFPGSFAAFQASVACLLDVVETLLMAQLR